MAEFNFGTLIRDANSVGKREFVGNAILKIPTVFVWRTITISTSP